MTGVDEETLDLFVRSVRGVLGEGADDSTSRLEELGWCDILAVDAAAVVPLVFRLHGERRARSAILDDVARRRLADVDLAGAVYAHPRPGSRAAAAVEGNRLAVDALALRDPSGAPIALVAREADGVRLVRVAADVLEATRVEGIDPSLGVVRVAGSLAIGTVDVRVVEQLDLVEADCRRALAYELVGIGSAMLATAAEYAGVRMQYGHPIGTFQAVKHRLADVLVAVRAAEVVADESWESNPAFTATAAKCLAGEAFRLAAENCLQVLGAIGFTWEHDLHRFIRRGMVLDGLYGSARELRLELGHALGRGGPVPRPGVL